MHQHQFHELANSRTRDLQRLAERQRIVAACKQELRRQTGSKQFKNPSAKAFRQQARGAPQH